ncbi:MAG: extracellular solute-binding protein family 1 [Paenibacillaceae bacterium]|nr:extracellular solute-binding protein family 1 [Paenibacillaceae bacterium]
MLRKSMLVILSAIMVLVFAACGGGSGAKEGTGAAGDQGQASGQVDMAKPANPDPVTLTFYFNTVLDDYDKYVGQYVKKKFPFVTMNIVQKEKGKELTDLITAGEIPDIVWEGLTNIRGSLELNLPMDLTAVAKKQKFDFGKYDPTIVDSIKSYSEHGEIYYLPFNVLYFAAQYNKDIFDKFGVPYLKDNMTWDEMIEVGKRMARNESGVQYTGLQINNTNRIQTQLSNSYVDSKTSKANFQTDGWKKMLELLKTVQAPPGQPVITKLNTAVVNFYDNKTLAISPDIFPLQNRDMAAVEKQGLKWGAVTFPVFKDRPGIGPGVFSDGFYVPNGSKHVDLAFQIISYLSSDPEVQLAATKDGRVSGLKDASIRKHAFENNPAAKGKDFSNIFNIKFAPPYYSTQYDKDGLGIINKKVTDYINSKSDVNTLLRQADDELNQKIAEKKSQ